MSASLALLLSGAGIPYGTLYGFTVLSSDRERAVETQFLDIPSAAGALATAATLTAQPHPAGSSGDHQLALFLRDQFASFGFASTIETFTARVDTLKSATLTLYAGGPPPPVVTNTYLAHGIFNRPRRPRAPKAPKVAATPLPLTVTPPTPPPPLRLDLREPPIESDPDSANPAIGIPFLAGSADGALAAPLVYAGHGGEADYALLAAHDIDPRGAVLLVRTGREFRGIVARRAQARGVAAVLFFDDPADEGAAGGAPYPFGPYRPLGAVRRGTVGDGVVIPVLPISAANARILLGALHGPSAPAPWRGGLPVGYPFARGPAGVRLDLHLVRKLTTLYNTVAVMAGTRPEQIVLLGAHRDAWVFGAGDDGSGVETLVEAARGLGYIAKTGWQPVRTIVISTWDGEGLGAFGSTAYARAHADEFRFGGVAYLEAEQTVLGSRFGANASAAIGGVVGDATHAVDDPVHPGGSLFDSWGRYTFALPPRAIEGAGDHIVSSLFDLGVPSANAGFSGPFGVAGSAYDTTTYASTISDPAFELHRSAGQLYGIMAMRIADADVVPYHFGAYVPAMQSAVRSLAATARAGKLRFDAAGLGSSIARLRGAALRFDAATAAATNAARSDAALEAARTLDVTAYGGDGYVGLGFPEIAHAIAAGNQGDLDGAIRRTRGAIDHAADLLL